MLLYSIIIPVYNRPGEIQELLESLSAQTVKPFELLIIEDGSKERCDHLLDRYRSSFTIHYYYKPNSGRSDTRNYGMERATGDYLLFFDSDVILPPFYFERLQAAMEAEYCDCFGGPDAADASFSDIQKAVNHSMTGFWTTGGIRGGKVVAEKFCPRTFNMGLSRAVYERVGGFEDMMGEDIDLSIRIREAGFKTRLIREAFVYHKRRVDLTRFFKQVNNFGQARIWLHIKHPGSLKIVHTLPALMLIAGALLLMASILYPWLLLLPAAYLLLIFFDSLLKNKSLKVAAYSVVTAIVQISGYGTGFLKAFWYKLILKQPLETKKNLTKLYNRG
ncbi:MAG: glycosyltransferase [Bacteroidaceae bacterium]|nr:glycosyltransferase [Bacteroidaceae bacterium]MBR3856293.1 glycosyltransferase [Bacteroidaceae bacterium]